MMRDVSSCNTYDYGDANYWDARYVQEGDSLFDWYQRYSALRPFIRNFIPDTSSPVLVVGCGNAVMSEDMAKDGYQDIMNIDISSVAINLMKTRNQHIPQLKYKQMDVRDMSFFPDESFDGIVDKGTSLFSCCGYFLIYAVSCTNYVFYGLVIFCCCHHFLHLRSVENLDVGTLDSLMCGNDAPISAAQMLGEVNRLLKPGGVYILITYGDPKVRMPHLSRPVYDWNTVLYIQRVVHLCEPVLEN
uniref:uncharacterized protein LOC101299615 isoform X3 n=1 Tax=Fragaria vesca subsp. vesca TaxID=101020 RepID=UPI0005C82E09|nr:PREDICTED: uncharacterized protein LOC101299615 isoform X3 [Fragaria vesca subsp. vesca]